MSTELDDLKIHLNITDDADDAVIEQKLGVAKAWVESICGAAFASPPPEVAEATRLLAAHLFANREAVLVNANAQELPLGVEGLLNPYKAWAF